jgi:hypothetical protein
MERPRNAGRGGYRRNARNSIGRARASHFKSAFPMLEFARPRCPSRAHATAQSWRFDLHRRARNRKGKHETNADCFDDSLGPRKLCWAVGQRCRHIAANFHSRFLLLRHRFSARAAPIQKTENRPRIFLVHARSQFRGNKSLQENRRADDGIRANIPAGGHARIESIENGI